MENKINIAHILKDAPKEIKLYSPILGDCEFDHISEDIIYVKAFGTEFLFNEYGHMFTLEIGHTRECVLFPSKDCRTWENFKAPWLHKQFEPLTPILFKHYNGSDAPMTWELGIYCRYDKETNRHIITNDNKLDDSMIIAYDDNKDLLGKEVE